MPRLPKAKLLRQWSKTLLNGFESLTLKNKQGQSWQLTQAQQPETGERSVRAQNGEQIRNFPEAELLDQLWQLSQDGFIKHSYLLASRRLSLDARYAKLKDKPRVTDSTRSDPVSPQNASKLLQAIGLMNDDGSLSARARKKYKQVNDFARVCEPLIKALPQNRPLKLVDLACGNSYLSFVLAWVLRDRGLNFELLGVDRRPDLVARSQARAEQLGFDNLSFEARSLEDLELGEVDLTLALHACDTATDEALIHAVRAQSRAIMVVPCCQNELFRQLEGQAQDQPELCGPSLVRRAYATALTDGLRVMALEALGYKVQVLEFTASVHTAKSLMLRARKVRSAQADKVQRVRDRCLAHGVQPRTLALLDL